MRRRIASGLVAALMATGAGTVAVPPPARADVCPDYQQCSPSPDSIARLAFLLIRIGEGGLTPEALEALITEAVGLMRTVQNEVIQHSNTLLVELAVRHLGTLLTEARSYPILRQDDVLLWDFLKDVLWEIDENLARFTVVSGGSFPDLKGADDIARALSAEYPLVQAAVGDWARSFDPVGGPGWQRDIEDRYIETMRAIRTKLEPKCHRENEIADSFVYSATVVCVAATGRVASRPEYLNKTTGTWVIGPVNQPALVREAAIESAWLEATMVLEHLGIP